MGSVWLETASWTKKQLALLGSEIFMVSAIPIFYVLCAKKVLNMTKKNQQHQLSQRALPPSWLLWRW